MRGRRRIIWLAAALVAVVLAGWAITVALSGSSAKRPGTSASGSGGSGGKAGPCEPQSHGQGTGPVKPVIRGLIDRQGEPTNRFVPVVHAYVVKVNWADLQPTANGPIAACNAIDKAIARVRQQDFAAVGMTLKLRVFAGIGAPDWAKRLGGAPLPFVNTQAGGSVAGGTIGRFWTPAFGRAYDDLQTKLAALYDDVPEIRETSISRCSTLFDESFVRQFGDKRNVASFRAGGYTAAADEQCIRDSIAAHGVWRRTTSDIALSPFPSIDDPGSTRDLTVTQSVMTFCRKELGTRCGLQNNAISIDKLNNELFRQLYDDMTRMGPPIILQTAAVKRLGDEASVLEQAAKVGANSVELPKGYQKWSRSLLVAAKQNLEANPVR